MSPRERSASDSIAAFKNHLRDSWDEALDFEDDHPHHDYNIIDGRVDNNEDHAALTSSTRSSHHHQHHRRSRHRQNLSVQFLEFNISGDDLYEKGTVNTTNASERRIGKETIEGSASYYFNPPSPAPSTSPSSSSSLRNNAHLTMGGIESSNSGCNSEEGGAFTISNSNDNSNNDNPGQQQQDRNSDYAKSKFFEGGQEKEQRQQQKQQLYHHHQQLHLSEQERKHSSQSLECNEEKITASAYNSANAREPPAFATASASAAATATAATNSVPCEKQPLPKLPSHESTPELNAIFVDHHRLSEMIQPLRLGSDSPISPSFSSASYSSETTDIITPIPLRTSGGSSSSVGGSGGGNRKHRRVFSGQSFPAVVHRRVNTRGDKCAPPGGNVFKAETLNDPIEGQQVQHYQQEQQRHQERKPQQQEHHYHHQPRPQNDHPLSPPTETTYHPHQHHPPPQMPYHNHGAQTPPTYYNSPQTSDSGFNCRAHHTSSPAVSGFPPPQEHPPQQAPQYHHQYPAHHSSSPSGYPSPGQVPHQLPPFHNQYPAHQSSPVASGYPPPPVQPPQQAPLYPNPGHQTPPLTLNCPPPQGQSPQQASPYHSQPPAHQTSPVVSGYPPPLGHPLQHAPVHHNQYPVHPTSPIVSGYPPPHEQSPSLYHSEQHSHHASPIASGYPQMQKQSPQQLPSYQYSNQTSPTVSGHPPPQAQPLSHAPLHYNQCYAHHPPPQAQPPHQTSYLVRSTIHPPPPILTQPSLEEHQSRSRSNSRNQDDLMSSEVGGIEGQQRELSHNPFPHNEKGRLLARVSLKGHRKEPSYNPLPYIDTNERHSIGSFLATTTLFDDDLSDKGEDYTSAAEEGDAIRHSRNNSLTSLAVTRLEQFVDRQSNQLDTSVGKPHPQRPTPPPPGMIPSDGYSMLSTSPVVSHVMARQSPPGSLPDYSHPPLHPPPPPMQHTMHSTSPVISSSMAYQPFPLGSAPGNPPTPPEYHPPTPPAYPHSATPPQSSWHPPHQQHSPTYHNMPHQSPQHQIMEYHQTPPYQHPQPHPGMQHHTLLPYGNVPPPPCVAYTHCFYAQQPLCPPTARSTGESSQSSGGSAKERNSRRKCSVRDCPNRVVQGGLCIAHGAKRKTCSVEGCTKNVKKLGLCSTHGPARKRCEYEGCTKVAVKSGRCITHGARKKVCSHYECEKQAIVGGMCKRHYDEANGIVKGHAPVKMTTSEEDDDEDYDDISSDEQADPKDVVLVHQATETGDGARRHHHQRGLSLFHDSELMNTIINNGVPPVENDGLHGLSILHKDDTGDLEATPSNLKE